MEPFQQYHLDAGFRFSEFALRPGGGQPQPRFLWTVQRQRRVHVFGFNGNQRRFQQQYNRCRRGCGGRWRQRFHCRSRTTPYKEMDL